MDWKDMLQGMRDEMPDAGQSADAAPDFAQPDSSGDGKGSGKKDTLHIAYERKGRAGKSATIIYGFTCPDEELKETARVLKQKTGVGGSARGGEILLQGDLRSQLPPLLQSLGYKTR